MENLMDNSSCKQLGSVLRAGQHPLKKEQKWLDFVILPPPAVVSFVFKDVLDKN